MLTLLTLNNRFRCCKMLLLDAAMLFAELRYAVTRTSHFKRNSMICYYCCCCFNVSQHAIRLTLFFIENLTLQILISMIHLMHPLMVSVPCKARYHSKRKHFAINSTKYLSMTCLCVLFNSGAKKRLWNHLTSSLTSFCYG